MGRLDGKVAIISGGAKGQGAEEARLFAQEGAKVIIGDILDREGMQIESEIAEQGGEAKFVHLDVSSEEDWSRTVDLSMREYGKLDILVNNAGILLMKGLEETSGQEWDNFQNINSKGVFLGSKAVIQAMRESGGGSIVNISSIAGLVGLPNASAYVSAKHAIIGLTKTEALEYAQSGISINAISPGWTRTDLIKHKIANKEQEKILADRHPIGRLCEPEEIAETVVWLCTKAPRSITGTVIPVDGGFSAK